MHKKTEANIMTTDELKCNDDLGTSPDFQDPEQLKNNNEAVVELIKRGLKK